MLIMIIIIVIIIIIITGAITARLRPARSRIAWSRTSSSRPYNPSLPFHGYAADIRDTVTLVFSMQFVICLWLAPRAPGALPVCIGKPYQLDIASDPAAPCH